MAQETSLVLDASVAIKWFNEEPFRENALAMRRAFRDGRILLAAPSLLKYEIANALRYKPKFGVDEVSLALRSLQDLQLNIHEYSDQLVSESVQLAYRFGITVYDAAYVALAFVLRAVLYTADDELVEKIPGEYVRHVSSFQT